MRVSWAALVAVLTLTACTSAERPSVERAGDTVMMVDTRSDEGMDAQVAGTLTVSPQGCLSVVGEGDTEAVPVIWPRGTKLVEDGAVVELPSGERISVGKQMTLGGGYTRPSADQYPSIPEECRSSGEIAVLSA